MSISNLERYKKDFERLVATGKILQVSMLIDYDFEVFEKSVKIMGQDAKELQEKTPRFQEKYQAWYSESKAVIKQLLPDRLDDFVRHYERPKGRKELNFESYRIEDCLHQLNATRRGEVIVAPRAAISHFEQQLRILEALQARFESSLFNIRQLVQADLFDSELDAARELLSKGFFRAAGAIAGVVLEKHLAQVASNHSLSIKKVNPTVGDFNDLLKNANVMDTPQWRGIQRLGDLRNLCDHNKHREPTKEDCEELIDGVDKLSKTLF